MFPRPMNIPAVAVFVNVLFRVAIETSYWLKLRLCFHALSPGTSLLRNELGLREPLLSSAALNASMHPGIKLGLGHCTSEYLLFKNSPLLVQWLHPVPMLVCFYLLLYNVHSFEQKFLYGVVSSLLVSAKKGCSHVGCSFILLFCIILGKRVR